MSKKPRRIIQAAKFDGPIGVVSADELLCMDENTWGVLRDRITDHKSGKEGLEARCMLCGSPVFIACCLNNGMRLPYFSHYKGGDPTCKWYHGKTRHPDALKAAQFKGQQTSPAHDLMCETIAEVVQLDRRYLSHEIEKYLPPTKSKHGRFPDVLVEWDSIGKFAIEFQLSNTYQTEVSQRCVHYEREGVPLLWVLYGLDKHNDIPQCFRDVIRRHRGNAFVLDSAACKASFEQRTLVLSCYRKTRIGLERPVLVRFDDLTIPTTRIPYYEDRIVPPLLAEIKARRTVWFDAFNDWDQDTLEQEKIVAAMDTLQFKSDFRTVRLIATAFAIVSAANDDFKKFASQHDNIKAMLNTFLSPSYRTLAPYSDLLRQLIDNTAARNLINPKVIVHLDRARAYEQKGEESPEWIALKDLIPEALDPLVREELRYFGALPKWALG